MKTMKSYKQFLNENLNERIFQKQYDWKLNLKPGDVIFAKEDYDVKKDVDFAKYADSKIGQISKLNTRNLIKNDVMDLPGIDWKVGSEGDIIAVVLENGNLSFYSGWSSNINDKEDYILIALNILYIEGKIDVYDYTKLNKDLLESGEYDEERKLIFKGNLYSTGISQMIIEDDKYHIQFGTGDTDYNIKEDVLYVENAYDLKTDKGGYKYRIENASKLNFITKDGEKLNKI